MKKVHKVMTLYTKIKTELLLRDESVEDMLRDTKLSPATLSNLKKSRPRRNTYEVLAEYFGLRPVDLYLLPITRQEIIDMSEEARLNRIESQYDVIEVVEKSKILPLPDNIKIRTFLRNQDLYEIADELLEEESQKAGREVTLDEYRQRFIHD